MVEYSIIYNTMLYGVVACYVVRCDAMVSMIYHVMFLYAICDILTCCTISEHVMSHRFCSMQHICNALLKYGWRYALKRYKTPAWITPHHIVSYHTRLNVINPWYTLHTTASYSISCCMVGMHHVRIILWRAAHVKPCFITCARIMPCCTNMAYLSIL